MRTGVCGTVLLSLLVLFVFSCAVPPKKTKPYIKGGKQVGVASWYGPGFHGRQTASGEIFDMHTLTAAHRTLPFGTLLQVKNRDNGRTVRVKVNDRGPFIKGRILDLSYAAAKELDMVGTGTAVVEIRTIGREERYVRREREKQEKRFTVQVGAFLQQENALKMKEELERRYQPVYIVISNVQNQRYYRVRVGRLQTEDQADQLASRLQSRENLEAFVLLED